MRRPPASPHPVLVALIGGAVGILTGLVGVGGGFLIVPALVLLLGVPVKEAVGTSLGVIALNSASGFAGYWGKVDVDVRMMAAFTAIAIVGVFLGTRLGPSRPAGPSPPGIRGVARRRRRGHSSQEPVRASPRSSSRTHVNVLPTLLRRHPRPDQLPHRLRRHRRGDGAGPQSRRRAVRACRRGGGAPDHARDRDAHPRRLPLRLAGAGAPDRRGDVPLRRGRARLAVRVRQAGRGGAAPRRRSLHGRQHPLRRAAHPRAHPRAPRVRGDRHRRRHRADGHRHRRLRLRGRRRPARPAREGGAGGGLGGRRRARPAGRASRSSARSRTTCRSGPGTAPARRAARG